MMMMMVSCNLFKISAVVSRNVCKSFLSYAVKKLLTDVAYSYNMFLRYGMSIRLAVTAGVNNNLLWLCLSIGV